MTNFLTTTHIIILMGIGIDNTNHDVWFVLLGFVVWILVESFKFG